MSTDLNKGELQIVHIVCANMLKSSDNKFKIKRTNFLQILSLISYIFLFMRRLLQVNQMHIHYSKVHFSELALDIGGKCEQHN